MRRAAALAVAVMVAVAAAAALPVAAQIFPPWEPPPPVVCKPLGNGLEVCWVTSPPPELPVPPIPMGAG